MIFDLGGTLIHWADWEEAAADKWGISYDHLATQFSGRQWPSRDAYVKAMRDAEREHWRRVEAEKVSGTPTELVRDGFTKLGIVASDAELLAAMDGYAKAVAGWSTIDPDAVAVLMLLRARGYRTGVLSNTWWAADWHNADLATHGLSALINEIIYTSDLPHSKPHPTVFEEIARRLRTPAEACVMVGDRMIDDVSGALGAGMRAVWRRNNAGLPSSDATPSGQIDRLTELPTLLRSWGGS